MHSHTAPPSVHRDELAVDHCYDFAPSDATVAPDGQRDHIQCLHHCITLSCGAAIGVCEKGQWVFTTTTFLQDAAVAQCYCTCCAAHSACEKCRQWITVITFSEGCSSGTSSLLPGGGLPYRCSAAGPLCLGWALQLPIPEASAR